MMRKGITPIIAIIVLLLITVALAGAAWTYLSTYMTGLTGQSVEVQDYFCINGDTPVIMIANTGTVDIPVSDIAIINMSDGTVALGAATPWTLTDGTTPISEIAVSSIGRWTGQAGSCSSVEDCTFRVAGGTARAQMARIFC